MDDVLTSVFQLLRLKSCVYFLHDFHGAWAMEIDGGPHAQFHVVARGHCVVETDGGTRIAGPGDVLLFPRGMRHVLGDAPGRPPVPGMAVMRAINENRPIFARGAVSTRLICGHYETRHDMRHSVLGALPEMIHVRAFDRSTPAALDTLLPLIMRELDGGEIGGRAIAARLAEVLLVQVLRAYLASATPETGFLAALADARLRPALEAIHARYCEPLTLAALAAAAGMSRSAFAARFRAVMGESPIAYLARWRMIQARELLRDTALPVAEIAARVGYESDIAFARAFRRIFADTPSRARRNYRVVATQPEAVASSRA